MAQTFAAPSASYTYSNTTSGTIPDLSCSGTPLTRTFNVTDDFTVNDLNVGVKITHTSRRHIVISIESPNSTTVELHNGALQGPYAHIDALFDQSAATEASTDTAAHDTTAPDYDVQWNPGSGSLDSFNGEAAIGTWTLSICDKQSSNEGTFTSARLDFDGTPRNVSGQIEGTVFNDVNGNGANNNEAGVQNVTVTAYDSAGNVAGTATTAANGTYAITGLTDGVQYRLELTNLPATYHASRVGTNSDTAVVFIAPPASSTDFGIYVPTTISDCVASSAEYVVSCFTNGVPTHSSNSSDTSVAKFDYLSAGTAQSGTNGYQNIAEMGTVGPVWGLAYDRNTGALYSASVVKRHVGSGPDGIGAIYKQTDVTDASTVSLHHNFGSAVGTVDSNAVRFPGTGTGFGQEGPCATCDNVDGNAFAWAGKRAFGDIDISTDGSTLYIVNTFDRQLYTLNTSGIPSHSAISGAPWITNADCSNNAGGGKSGVARPWAVTVEGSDVYVGVVCDASTSTLCNSTNSCADLTAHVYVYNGSTWSTAMSSSPLTYTRDLYRSANLADDVWHPWTDTYTDIDQHVESIVDVGYPQPILGDIEFADDGHMILSFLDRSSLQFGYEAPAPNGVSSDVTIEYFSSGDILQATESGGTYTLNTTEFYDDQWSNSGSFPMAGNNDDTIAGGIANADGLATVLQATSDTVDTFSAGVLFLDTVTGGVRAGQEVYQSTAGTSTFAKAGGLGDVEMICPLVEPKTEVGNRVWNDTNGNGIQDPGEAGISGVTVTLTCGIDSVSVVTATDDGATKEDEAGQFLFSNVLGGNATFMDAGEACTISIDTSQATLTNLALTQPNAPDTSAGDSGANSDARDSDATISSGDAVINFTVGADGENDHTFDVGFAEADFGDLPDTFDTTVANNGASHIMTSSLYLGSCVDSESNGAPDAAAGTDGSGGDDSSVGISTNGTCAVTNDDEDGVTLVTPLIPGNQACIEVDAMNSTGSTAVLQGWIDFNGDGDFDGDASDELSFVSANVANGGVTDQQYCFTVPSDATFDGGETHMRFRLSANGGLSFNGAAGNGEVEDYYQQLACVGNYVWNDTRGATANVQDGSDTAVSGATLRLVWAGADDVLDTSGSDGSAQDDDRVYTTTTDGNGVYNFCGLIPDATNTYRIDMTTLPSGLETAVVVDQGSDNRDSDGYQVSPGGSLTGPAFTISNPFNLPLGENGNQDNPGSINNFPDVQDQINFDFGLIADISGAIGNFVWVDENSDGYQDAGEPGIPNVTVNLYNVSGSLVATTVTDSHGGYLFTDLPAGTYYVDVADGTDSTSNSLPSGLTQTTPSTLAGSDFGNQDHGTTPLPGGSGRTGYQIVLGAGEENLTADFGYNYNPTTDVNSPTGDPTAALGDRVWIDSDGDGHQDPNEIGVSNVTVTLTNPGADGIFGTGDDTTQTTTTDENGYYLFDNLTPGVYTVTVTSSGSASHDVLGSAYSQTGDPDHFGTTGSNNDNTTTTPIVLGPGDVFLNADFGYQPTSASLGSIGDTVFFDADADGNGPSLAPVDGGAPVTQGAGGTADSSDYGIAGVTVSLIRDSNGNGVWDSGEPIIATDLTDGNGQYLFVGLPITDGTGSDDYLVWVNDTHNVLGALTPTYDADGLSPQVGLVNGLGMSAVADLAGDVRDQDFGYSVNTPQGSIGDTVWFDVDNSGGNQTTQGAEPGISHVTLLLYVDADNNGTPDDINGDGSVNSSDVVATTVTDSNGNYLFTGLPLGSYVVGVDTSTLPAGFNTTATYEPDGDTDNYGVTVTLTAAQPANRDQDFSYTLTDQTLGSIGDTIFGDLDSSESDGIPDAGDVLLSGVVVILTPPAGVDLGNGAGQPVYTTTNENGNYLFTSLPAGNYTVTVDTTTLPAGFSTTPTYDPDGGSNSSSNVTLAAGEDNRAQDFSYPPTGTDFTIGDTVWFDVNNSGGDQSTQGSEPGIAGVTINLYDSTDTLIDTAITDENGYYLFTGLTADTYRVEVETETLPSYVSPTSTYAGSDGSANDSESSVVVNAGNPHGRAEDFSYPPLAALGLIGDTVWFDLDGSGGNQSTQGTEPGLEGVTLTLTDSDGNVWTTVTDENGRYAFGNLPLNQTYTVVVDASNFASGGVLEGMSLTYDPDGGTPANTGAAVTLTAASPVNLDQDFSYTGSTGQLGNLVWLDRNADGDYDSSSESPIGNVTVDLYRDLNCDGNLGVGEGLFGQVTTAAAIDSGSYGSDGTYLFSNLPVVGTGSGGGACFIVNVSDNNGVLVGYWHSLGTTGSDNNSQIDPYGSLVLTSGSPSNLTADFGYYLEPGELGNRVWIDSVENGLQDVGEPGINDIVITLSIDYGNGNTPIVLKTATSNDPATGEAGWYTFGNLLLDEDYNGDGSGSEPTYTISADLTGYTPTTIDVGSNGSDDRDADNPAGVTTGGSDPSGPTQGETNRTPLGDTSGNSSANDDMVDATTEANPRASFDFGITLVPTAVSLNLLASSPALPEWLWGVAVALILLTSLIFWRIVKMRDYK